MSGYSISSRIPGFVDGCTGKAPIGSHAQAVQVAARMRKKHQTGCRVEAYRCKHCGQWHVGQNRNEKLKRAA